MNFDLSEWLNLTLRWTHVFAAILWVGQTYFFIWLDGRLTAEEKAGAIPQVWMVHSGGFYVVGKQTAPELERKLYWFRWEAAFTWLSGMLLLGIVYYMGGLMVDTTVAHIRLGTAAGIGMGTLIIGWAVYDLLWQSPLGKSEAAGVIVSFLLLVAVAFGLTHLLSGRAAYIHVGALMGTIMTANVWMQILPVQRRMLAATKAGMKPDPAQAARAKMRTKHNTYMAVPVVFIMVSNHFPVATYGSRYNWVILAILILAGWGAAKLIRRV